MTTKQNNSLPMYAKGLGGGNATIHIYIENTPPLPEYQHLTSITPLNAGDIKNIGELTGNHWRKIFNVLAKILFELDPNNFPSWQLLRDSYLLQRQSHECLIFSGTNIKTLKAEKLSRESNKVISLIMGKTYAKKLEIDKCCYWLSENFAINTATNIIICPYFDYRQLSNIKIAQLVQLIKQLKASSEPLIE